MILRKKFELASFTLLLLMVNCAHQDDNDFMRGSSHNRQPSVTMIPPPKVPPKGNVPMAAVPATKESTIETPALPAPKVAKKPEQASPKGEKAKDKGNGKGKEKAPHLADLQLSINEALSPPLRRLITTAEENLKKGKVLEARAQADRAYRMDLRDPRTSFLKAKVSASESDFDGAEQWAMRALENIDDSANKAVVWGLIARVREKSGNKIGAAEAMKKRRDVRR